MDHREFPNRDATWFFAHFPPPELVSAVSGSLESISIAYSIAEASLHAYQSLYLFKGLCQHLCRLRIGPELEITGYGCLDHFLEGDVYLHSWESLAEIIQNPVSSDILLDIGMPVCHRNGTYIPRLSIPSYPAFGTFEICLVVPASSSLNSLSLSK